MAYVTESGVSKGTRRWSAGNWKLFHLTMGHSPKEGEYITLYPGNLHKDVQWLDGFPKARYWLETVQD